jgi:hypothetical protein
MIDMSNGVREVRVFSRRGIQVTAFFSKHSVGSDGDIIQPYYLYFLLVLSYSNE